MKFFCGTLIVLFSMSALAETPGFLIYDGVLSSQETGDFISGPVDFTVEVLSKDNPLCVIYKEQHNAVNIPVENEGAFSLKMGSATAVVLHGTQFNEAFVNGQTHSCDDTSTHVGAVGESRMIRLTVAFGPDVEVLDPPMEVASVPSAMVADSAHRLGNKTALDFVQTRVDAGTQLSQLNLEDVFSSTNYPILQALLAGTNSVDSAAVVDGSIADADISDVGVSKLSNDVTCSDGQVVSFNSSSGFFECSTPGGGGDLLSSANLSDLGNLATARTNLGLGSSAVLNAGTAANELVQLDGAGKLPAVDGSQLTGIPADTTLTEGQVETYVNNADFSMSGNAITNVLDPTLAQDAATKNYVDANLTGAPLAAPTIGQDGQSIRWNNSGGNWEFFDAGDGDFKADGTVPLANGLNFDPDVDHNITVSRTTGSVGKYLLLQAGSAKLSSTDNAGGDLILSSGIATGNAQSRIEFKTATPGGTGVTDNFPDVKMVIDGAGNVGIGTPTPNAKLDVAGAIYADTICDETGAGCVDISMGFGGGGDFLASGSVIATGNFDLGTNKITNLGDPVSPQDAATMNWVQSQGYGSGNGDFLASGSVIASGNFDLGTNKITNLGDPVSPQDAATMNWVQSQGYGSGNGDFLASGSVIASGNFDLGTNKITNLGDPVSPQDAATMNWVQSQGYGSGNGDFLASGSVIASGNFDLGTNKITNLGDPVSPQDAATMNWVQSQGYGSGNGDFLASGSVIASGNFDLGTNKITNLGDPVSPQDAATMNWVQSQGYGSGDFKADGSVPMGGQLDLGTNFLKLAETTGVPIAGECDNTSKHGRVKIDPNDQTIYLCTAAGWQKFRPAESVVDVPNQNADASYTLDGNMGKVYRLRVDSGTGPFTLNAPTAATLKVGEVYKINIENITGAQIQVDLNAAYNMGDAPNTLFIKNNFGAAFEFWADTPNTLRLASTSLVDDGGGLNENLAYDGSPIVIDGQDSETYRITQNSTGTAAVSDFVAPININEGTLFRVIYKNDMGTPLPMNFNLKFKGHDGSQLTLPAVKAGESRILTFLGLGSGDLQVVSVNDDAQKLPFDEHPGVNTDPFAVPALDGNTHSGIVIVSSAGTGLSDNRVDFATPSNLVAGKEYRYIVRNNNDNPMFIDFAGASASHNFPVGGAAGFFIESNRMAEFVFEATGPGVLELTSTNQKIGSNTEDYHPSYSAANYQVRGNYQTVRIYRSSGGNLTLDPPLGLIPGERYEIMVKNDDSGAFDVNFAGVPAFEDNGGSPIPSETLQPGEERHFEFIATDFDTLKEEEGPNDGDDRLAHDDIANLAYQVMTGGDRIRERRFSRALVHNFADTASTISGGTYYASDDNKMMGMLTLGASNAIVQKPAILSDFEHKTTPIYTFSGNQLEGNSPTNVESINFFHNLTPGFEAEFVWGGGTAAASFGIRYTGTCVYTSAQCGAQTNNNSLRILPNGQVHKSDGAAWNSIGNLGAIGVGQKIRLKNSGGEIEFYLGNSPTPSLTTATAGAYTSFTSKLYFSKDTGASGNLIIRDIKLKNGLNANLVLNSNNFPSIAGPSDIEEARIVVIVDDPNGVVNNGSFTTLSLSENTGGAVAATLEPMGPFPFSGSIKYFVGNAMMTNTGSGDGSLSYSIDINTGSSDPVSILAVGLDAK